jgi:hypothetical protein
MNKDNYIFETLDTDDNGVSKTRIKIPRDSIRIGQKIYHTDFYYPDGIQELEVRGIEDYITISDPQTGELFTRPIKAGEVPDGYEIELGDDWTTHPYEKYLTKEDAYEASLEDHYSFMKDNQAMIDRWQISVDNTSRRIETIKDKLKSIRSSK